MVSGHPVEHNGEWGTVTYEFECGHCGWWWLEHEPIPVDYWPRPLPRGTRRPFDENRS